MAGNFGIGLGSFLTGFTGGAQAAQAIKTGNAKQRMYDLEVKRAEDAAAANDQARAISTQGMQEAQANTDGSYDAQTNYYNTKVVPQLQQHWMAQGDMAKAEAFGKWMQDTNVQTGLKLGAGLIRSVQMGDPDSAKDYLMKLYNQPGYFEDGMTATEGKVTRDKDGNASGMEFTLRNDKTGKTTTQKFATLDDAYKVAMQLGQPEQVFKYGMEQLTAGQKATAELAKEEREWQRDNVKAERDQGYKLEGQNNASGLRMAEESAKTRANGGKTSPEAQRIEARRVALKLAGWDDKKIDAHIAKVIGFENKDRPMASRMDDFIKAKIDSDRAFAKLPVKEQQDQALEALLYQDKLVSQHDNQEQGFGLPTAPADQQQAVPYFDTKTGQIISRPY